MRTILLVVVGALLLVPAVAAKGRPTTTLVAVGDLMLDFGRPPSPQYPFEKVTDLLGMADVRLGNLECAVSRLGHPTSAKDPGEIRAGREFIFRADPDVLDGLRRAGFDVLSVANNHSMDYTDVAFMDTLKGLRASGIHPAGGGPNLSEARHPAVVRTSGGTLAVLAYSDVVPAGYAATATSPGLADAPLEAEVMGIPPHRFDLGIFHDIARARKHADIVVVFFHWGRECVQQATPYQESLAHRCIDAGADLVLGAHPHVLQGLEVYRGRLIAYSLGNFAFNGAGDLTRRTGLLYVTFEGRRTVGAWFLPAYIRGFEPEPAGASTAAAIADNLSQISARYGTRFTWQIRRGQKVLGITFPSASKP